MFSSEAGLWISIIVDKSALFRRQNQLIYLIFPAKIAVTGGYRYGNGTVFVGNWNNTGLRDGLGHLQFPDNTRYDGYFADGLFNGLGVLTFIDGAK